MSAVESTCSTRARHRRSVGLRQAPTYVRLGTLYAAFSVVLIAGYPALPTLGRTPTAVRLS
ncbi:hypothetical protein HC031_10290 [Planosporangium thailandense]|uniref:Uncharacterized protein n=1 Tax=Planosporangium thailandense TaxID=765197 RepID=A0ABX0XVN2_9ACTN|nr:hypothetical protein [Planosporangium thailandense]NJC70096.1 hypothetical protein [Planosporangium thailandense]